MGWRCMKRCAVGCPRLSEPTPELLPNELSDLRGLQLTDWNSVVMLSEALGTWYGARDAWSEHARSASIMLRAWSWDDMATRIVALTEAAGR